VSSATRPQEARAAFARVAHVRGVSRGETTPRGSGAGAPKRAFASGGAPACRA
jgi:hypothetical protein